jgi:hypothetical protein
MPSGGLGSVNFQFYLNNPIDSWIPYNTEIDFAAVGVQRRLYGKIYAGLEDWGIYFRIGEAF